jgi:hypothetical protein
MDLKINSDCFPNSINRLGFVVEKLCVSCKVKSLHSAYTVYLCVPYGSRSKQRLFPQTAFTGWGL